VKRDGAARAPARDYFEPDPLPVWLLEPAVPFDPVEDEDFGDGVLPPDAAPEGVTIPATSSGLTVMITCEPSGAWARTRNDSAAIWMFLNPDCSRLCRSFCCVSAVMLAGLPFAPECPGWALDEEPVPWASAGAAISAATATRRGVRIRDPFIREASDGAVSGNFFLLNEGIATAFS
jgi:hypothetical protein